MLRLYIPLISETDIFVYGKLDTPKQKVQLKINFNLLKGKFQFSNFFTLYKIMLLVLVTSFEIKSHTLLHIIFSSKIIGYGSVNIAHYLLKSVKKHLSVKT